MATDLQGEKNQFYRLFKQFRDESRAVTIATVSLFVAALALFAAALATNASNRADLRSESEIPRIQREFEALKENTDNEVRLWIVYIQDLEARIKELEDVKQGEAESRN